MLSWSTCGEELQVNAFHCKSILSGSFRVVGSFFENLAIIKTSVSRVMVFAATSLLPRPVSSDSSPFWACALSRTEKGQQHWRVAEDNEWLLRKAWARYAWCVPACSQDLFPLSEFLSLFRLLTGLQPNMCSHSTVPRWMSVEPLKKR